MKRSRGSMEPPTLIRLGPHRQRPPAGRQTVGHRDGCTPFGIAFGTASRLPHPPQTNLACWGTVAVSRDRRVLDGGQSPSNDSVPGHHSHDRFRAASSANRMSSCDPLLPLANAPRGAAMWPIAVIRSADLSDSSAAKAAGHQPAVSKRRRDKNLVPVSGRPRRPANDPNPRFGDSNWLPQSRRRDLRT